MKRHELREYLVYEAEYDEEDVSRMSDYEMFDAYLQYEGIIGYTEQICDVLEALGIKKQW